MIESYELRHELLTLLRKCKIKTATLVDDSEETFLIVESGECENESSYQTFDFESLTAF